MQGIGRKILTECLQNVRQDSEKTWLQTHTNTKETQM